MTQAVDPARTVAILFCVVTMLTSTLAAALTAAEERAGEYIITTIRAAPGAWVELKTLIEAQGVPGDVAGEDRAVPYRIRHSQGDQWDFMLIQPISGGGAYFQTERQMADARFRAEVARLADFSEDWIVSGPSHDELAQLYAGAGLYHVEMFRARAGLKDELIDQRQRENDFLAAIGETTNAVFVGKFGADWDVMTIGFHENLTAYAASGGASAEEEDAAARANGFDGTAGIAPYLRSLLVSHNDTLAVTMD